MVQYPSEVRRRAQEADAQIKEIAQQVGPTIELASTAPQAEYPTSVSPVQPVEAPESDESEPNTAADGGPESPETPKTITFVPRAEVERALANRSAPEAGWEQRFKVLQGKYNREMADLRAEVRAQKERNDDLRELLANRPSSRRDDAPAAQVNGAAAPRTLAAPQFRPVTEAEEKEYGKEYLDAASRYTLQQLDPVVRPLLDEIEGLKSEIRRVSSSAESANRSAQQTAVERVKAALAASVPNYEAINEAPEFLGWLEQKDRLSGESRGRLLERAWRRGDTEAIVAAFQAFKAEYVDVNEHVSSSSAIPDRPQVQKETLVGPARGRSVQRNGTQQEQIVWTEAGIAAFFRDDRLGKFKNNLAERDRLEADIFRAQRDGRVQP